MISQCKGQIIILILLSSISIPAMLIVKVGQLIGFNFEIRGQEHIRIHKGSVVIINHQSIIDLIGN